MERGAQMKPTPTAPHRLAKSFLSLVVLTAITLLMGGSGCSVPADGKKITKQEEDLMRRPAGTVPMPPEAAEAMRKANQAPPPPPGVK